MFWGTTVWLRGRWLTMKRPSGSGWVRLEDDTAKAFYEHFNFQASPTDPYPLLLAMKDLFRIVRG